LSDAVPSIWEFILLGLGSYRIWRLLSEDLILDRPRRWFVRLGRDWQEGQPTPQGYRAQLAEFLNCAWCSGFWISLASWGAWVAFPDAILVVMTPLSISAAVGLVRERLDSV
jgi:Protein of unknown function (DUF1360)